MIYLNQTKNILKENSPFLYYIVLFHIFLTLTCIIGLLIDDRTLMGVNVWIKPLKFAISGGIYIATLGYLINLYPYSPRKKSILNNTVAFTLLVDLLIIIAQGARGVRSHYNFDTPLDSLVFAVMGIFVGINVLIMLIFIIDTLRLKLNTTKAIQWSICMGWLIVFFGSWVGGQMISQMAHNVGTADGGPGLPLVNWSTKAGDLRIAHFFGLHGIQIIPLFAFILSKKWKSTFTKQILAVTIFGLSYAAWIGFTFYQAKQGMPLIKM